jgi:hypothetical protein
MDQMEEQKPSIIVGGGTFQIRRKHNKLEKSESLTIKERLTKFKSSLFYYVFHIVVIFLCIILLLWTIIRGGHPRDLLFVLLEGIVTFLFVADVAIEIIVTTGFWSSWVHLLDGILCLGCVLSFVFYILSRHLSLSEEIESIVGPILISFRFLVQIMRIISFLVHQKRLREAVNDDLILDGEDGNDLQKLLEVGEDTDEEEETVEKSKDREDPVI